MTLRRVTGTVHPESIPLAGLHRRGISVPAITRHLRQIKTLFRPFLVKEAKLDAIGDLGKQ